MAKNGDEKKPDMSKFKPIFDKIRKLSDLSKTDKQAKDDPCEELREKMDKADREAAVALVAAITAAAADNPPGFVAAMATFIAKLIELEKAREKWIDCLARNNNPNKAEQEKRLKQLREYRAQLVREKEKLGK